MKFICVFCVIIVLMLKTSSCDTLDESKFSLFGMIKKNKPLSEIAKMSENKHKEDLEKEEEVDTSLNTNFIERKEATLRNDDIKNLSAKATSETNERVSAASLESNSFPTTPMPTVSTDDFPTIPMGPTDFDIPKEVTNKIPKKDKSIISFDELDKVSLSDINESSKNTQIRQISSSRGKEDQTEQIRRIPNNFPRPRFKEEITDSIFDANKSANRNINRENELLSYRNKHVPTQKSAVQNEKESIKSALDKLRDKVSNSELKSHFNLNKLGDFFSNFITGNEFLDNLDVRDNIRSKNAKLDYLKVKRDAGFSNVFSSSLVSRVLNMTNTELKFNKNVMVKIADTPYGFRVKEVFDLLAFLKFLRAKCGSKLEKCDLEKFIKNPEVDSPQKKNNLVKEEKIKLDGLVKENITLKERLKAMEKMFNFKQIQEKNENELRKLKQEKMELEKQKMKERQRLKIEEMKKLKELRRKSNLRLDHKNSRISQAARSSQPVLQQTNNLSNQVEKEIEDELKLKEELKDYDNFMQGNPNFTSLLDSYYYNPSPSY